MSNNTIGDFGFAEEREKKPRKIKFLEGNWLVFQEGEKLFATHFCNGGDNTPHKQQGVKQAAWFHNGLDVEKGGNCKACEEEMPKHLFMLAKVANAPL